MECIIDSNRGIYVPQQFVESYEDSLIAIDSELEQCLKVVREGPDNEDYWECWDEILDKARLRGKDGKVCTLYHDNDLFIVGEDEIWDEAGQEYVRYED